MTFIRSQVFCVFVSVFAVLFCVDLACRVEGHTIVKIANNGDDITLTCSRHDVYIDNYKRWFRNGTEIANREGVFINDPRFTQGVTNDDGADTNNIYISNIRMNDSATFECSDHYKLTIFYTYYLRVIRCSDCITVNNLDPDKIKVICTLDNYWTNQTLSKYITFNGNIYLTVILRDTFSFSISVAELNRLPLEFELLIHENEGRIKCMLPTQPTPSSFHTSTLSTTSLKQMTQNTASKKLPASISTSISTTKQHTPTNKNAGSNQNTRDGNIILIIAILGSVFILILIVIIIVQRCNKKKDRRENKDTGDASIEQENPEVRYESVEDGSGKGSSYTTLIKGLRETSLDPRSADHADKKEYLDVCYESVEDGSRKGPGYATSIKELRGTNRESKSTSKVGSSNSDYLYGNSAIITQHEQIRGTLQKGDQYDDVKIPGSGDDAEEIPLYEMPDEGPTRNTLKATPEAGQTPTLPKDEVDSVDALYVDVY